MACELQVSHLLANMQENVGVKRPGAGGSPSVAERCDSASVAERCDSASLSTISAIAIRARSMLLATEMGRGINTLLPQSRLGMLRANQQIAVKPHSVQRHCMDHLAMAERIMRTD